MKAPFPYFGGKSAVAGEVWRRFGGVSNYIEPFFGSGAVLLARPDWGDGKRRYIETVNDADGLLANFWRALAADPDGVAFYADWPVNEADLHARHLWLVGQREQLTDRLMADPEWCDVKAAGWWVWGVCAWIGSGWCSGRGPWVNVNGVLTKSDNGGRGINRQLPHLGGGGKGINRKLPHLAGGSVGINRRGGVQFQLEPIARRMRHVRVACGDWTRVLGAALWPFGGRNAAVRSRLVTAVFLDPPYGSGADGLYATSQNLEGERALAQSVWRWAVEHGDDPMLRICVAGHEDGRPVPDGWAVVRWDASKRQRGAAYTGKKGKDSASSQRSALETLWFSPHCLAPEGLADGATMELGL